jgi:glycosyltransferase involved in cell wall biosynthesis
MAIEPLITICLPAFRAERDIARSLSSALSQTYRDFRVIVSVDKADEDDTLGVIQSTFSDPRLEVIVQTIKQGFPGNINVLLDRVDTPYFTILPHDDEIEPRYLESLLTVLQGRPDASVAYTDVIIINECQRIHRHLDGLDTPLADRISAYYATGNMYIPMRGLSPRWVLDRSIRFPTEIVEGRSADDIYVLNLLLAGPGVRIEKPLFLKQAYANSTSHLWAKRAREDSSWHLATMAPNIASQLHLIASVDMPTNDRIACIGACLTDAMSRQIALSEPGEEHLSTSLHTLMTFVLAASLGSPESSPDRVSTIVQSAAMRRADGTLMDVLGMRARWRNDHSEAVRLLRAEPNIGVKRPEIAAAKAHSCISLNQPKQAYDAAIETEDTELLGVTFWLHLCKLLYDTGESPSAMQALIRARKSDPTHPGIAGLAALLK